MIDRYADRWAVVTGASSGLGAEFARLLAARGMHLVLIARRKDRLDELAKELHTHHGTLCDVIPIDLTEPDAVARIVAEIDDRQREIEMLVNNAGFGIVGEFANTDVDEVSKMVTLNVGAVTELTYRILPAMLERGHGAVVNLSSVAGLQPVAYMAAYSASKAYVLHFSEALWAELRESGVTVMGVCPGATETEFFEVAGVKGWLKKQRSHTPEQVVRKTLRALEKKKPMTIIGLWNKVRAFLVRLATRKRVVIETLKFFRPGRPKKKQPAAESEEAKETQPVG